MDVSRVGSSNRVTAQVSRSGQRAQRSGWVDHLARAGFVAYGVVHLLIAWVAFQLAFGGSRREASGKGAFEELASQPFGTVALWAVALGLLLLVLWRVLGAVLGDPDEEDSSAAWRKRAAHGVKAVLYAALAATALRTLLGDGGGGGDSLTGTVMSWPRGQALVVVAGLAVLAYGGWTMWCGWRERFLGHLDQEGRTSEISDVYRWSGKVGYLVKGLSVGLVGGLVVHAGWAHEGKEDKGLDDALRTVLEQPYGPYLLAAVAVGLACYGLFCFVRAVHLDR